MKERTHILIVEDKAADADLAKRVIDQVINNCEFQVVETRKDFLHSLQSFQPDVVLSDYSLPHFDGMKALQLTQDHAPLTPLIIWTGSMSEDKAVACMKAGANNYILKENPKQLGPAVVHALEEKDQLVARRKAEEDLQERERQLNTLLKNLPGPVYRRQNNMDFTMEFISDGVAELTGYPAEDLCEHRRQFGRMIHPDDQGRVWDEIQAAVEEKRFFELSYRIITATGEKKWLWERGQGVFNAEGQLQALEGFITDVTAKKQAEEALQDNERRFRALIQNGLASIALLAGDGTLLWESPAMTGTLQYPPNEHIGQNIFHTLMHPDDLAWTQDLFASLAKEPGSRQQATFRLRRADGKWGWVEAIATNMLDEPSVHAIVVNYRDITERRQAEEAMRESQAKYQNLVETSHDLIWSVDPEGKITFLNRAAREIYGYEPEELIGHSFFELMDQEHDDQFRQQFREAVTQIDETKEVESYVRHRDGRQRILSANSIVMRDDHGNVIGITGTSRDVTEHKRAQVELQKRNDDLALINALNEIINRGEHVEAVIDRLRNEVKRIFSAEYTNMYLLNQNEHSLKLHRYSIPMEITRKIEKLIRREIPSIEIPIQEDGLFQSALHSNRGLVTSAPNVIQKWLEEFIETASLSSFAKAAIRKLIPQIYKILNIRSVIIVPLISGGKTLGLLNVSSSKILTEQDLSRIENICGQLTTALHRRQVEELLNEERNLLRTLIDNIPDRIYAMDRQGRKTLSNTADWKASGQKSMEDMIGKTDFDTYPADLAEEFWQLDRLVLESGQSIFNYEEPGLDEEGNRVSILTTKIPLRDKQGSVMGLVGVGRDITERKQAEERINDLLAFNEKILNHSPIGILSYRITGECVFANQNAAFIVGTSIEALKVQNFNFIESWKTSGLYELVTQAITTQIGVTADIHLFSTFGKQVWITAHCMRFRSNEEDLVLLSMIDITERKRAEEKLRHSENRYRLATKATNDVIWEWDSASHQLLWTENTRHVFGYEVEEVGPHEKWWDDHLHPDDRERVVTKLESLMVGNESIWMEEYRFQRKDGSYAYVRDRGYVERDEDGRATRMIGAMSDITSRKEAEIERQAILEIMQGLANTKDLSEFLRLVHQSIARVIYAENLFVVLYQPERELFEEIYSVDQFDPPVPPARLGNSITSYVFRNGEPLLLTQERFDELVAQGEVELVGTNSASWLGVPLRTGGKTIGVIVVQDYEHENRYTERDRDFLTSIAAQIALVIERKRAEAAEREQRVLAEALRDTAETLSSTLDFKEVLDHILSAVGRVVPHDAASILLIQEGAARVVRSRGYEAHGFDPEGMGIELPLEKTTNLRQMFITTQPVVICDTHSYAGWMRTPATDWLRSNVGAPITIYGEVIGFICLDSHEPEFFTPVHAERLEAFANQAALAIHNSWLLQQAQEEILERRRAEEELRFEKERFESIAATVPGIICSMRLRLDGSLCMPFASPAIHDVYGFSPLELKEDAAPLFARIHPEDLTQTYARVADSAGTMQRWHDEFRYLHPAKGEIWIEGQSVPLQEPDGSIIWHGFISDITERKRSETILRASEERFRQLADNIQEVFWMTDAATDEELYMSPAAESIWGRSRESLLQEPGAFINSVFSEDRPTVSQAVAREKSGEKVEVEYRIVRPDGSIRWIWDRGFPIFEEEGKVKAIAGISADITERKEAAEKLRESQSRYRELFDNSPVSIWEEDYSLVKKRIDLLLQSGITDLKEYFSIHPELVAEFASLVKIVDVNQASLELYHVQRKEDLLTNLTEAVGKTNITHLQAELLGLLSPMKRFAWEGTDHTFDGRTMDVIVNGSIPHGYEDDWSKVIVTISDITERKQAEKANLRHLAELEALYENGLAVGQLLTPREIGERIIETFAHHLSWHHATIRLRQEDSDALDLVAFNIPNLTGHERADMERNFSSHINRVGQGLSGLVLQTGSTLRTGNVHDHPQYIDIHAGIQSGLYMPLRIGERVIGVISVESEAADAFTEQDERLLATFANQAAIAFENARLYQSARQELMERKRVAQELRESQERFQTLFENSPVGTWLEDFSEVAIWLEGLRSQGVQKLAEYLAEHLEELKHGVGLIRILNVNHAAVLMNGAQSKEQLIERIHLLLSEDILPQVMINEFEMIWKGFTSFGFEMTSHRLDGTDITGVQRFFIPLKNGAPDYARVIVTSTDITDRVNIENELRTSETHYRALADSITDILFEMDRDLRYIHWNKASERLTGIAAEDAIGKTMEEIFGATQEQHRIRGIYEDVLETHQPKSFETGLILAGEKRLFEINAYPSTRGVSVVAKDVTDRKRSEVILQKRFELMEFSAHHALDELMQRAVDEVSELTGSTIGFFHFIESDQLTLGMQTWSTNSLRLFQVPFSEGAHRSLDQAGVWAEALRRRRPLIQNDYPSLLHKRGLPQGHVPMLREMVIPIIRNERLMAVMGVGNKPQDYTSQDLEIAARLADYAWDVTERKQMQVALEAERNQLAQRVAERTADLSRANSNLARALRVKDEFLANMSHELRTPLNAILGLSESLGEQIAGPLNEKQQKYIATISESGHHLLSLINDILDLAKVESGQITLDINRVDIRAVSQASLRMIRQLAQKKNQEVSLEIDDGLGLMWADERRLKQMIVNLLSNAVKFTPENEKLGLEVHGEPNSNQVSITVWDHGIGIKREDLERLFQPFVQLDSGLAREASGTGLGLALVAQMARLHGGSVSVTSEPGKGSRFTIIVPWEPALAVDAATRMRTTGKFRAITFDRTNRPKILLVEDTQEVTLMIQDYLEQAGFHVVTAQDGAEAIRQAQLEHPNLILMDVQMPRMNGLEATRKLRSEPDFQHTPIIALTALAMPSDRERCIEAGMDEYISKPVNLKALVKIIQSCLFNHQETRQT